MLNKYRFLFWGNQLWRLSLRTSLVLNGAGQPSAFIAMRIDIVTIIILYCSHNIC